jgi:hypothetical protein
MTLTEKWKKGELPEGFYYVKDGENMIAEYLDGYFYNNGEPMTSFSGGVDEIIAPVPTFDEWKASEKYNKHLEEKIKIYERKDKQATETSVAYNKPAEENDKLKELLKRVVNATDFYHEIKTASVIDYGVWYNIANEINKALGEDK